MVVEGQENSKKGIIMFEVGAFIERTESDSMRSVMAELQKSFKASSLLSVSLVLVLLCLDITARASMEATRIVPVGVILDLNSKLGFTLNNSLALAVEDYHSAQQETPTKIHLIVRSISQKDTAAAAEAGRDQGDRTWRPTFHMQAASNLIQKEKVRAILGPQYSEQARHIVKLGEESQVPVIWFPITGPSLLPPPSSIYSDQTPNCLQFQAIAATMKALRWQSIVPIYEETEYGSHLVPCLSNVLKDMGIQMANITAVDSDLSDIGINSILDKLNSMQTHVFLVHMSMDLGTRFIVSAEVKDMMDEGYAWIVTQELSSLTDPQVQITNFTEHVDLTRYMQGALGVRPMDSNKTSWRKGKEINFKNRFNSSITTYGWWAYHTIEALAMAVEKTGTNNNGTKLGEEIQATNFIGKSGLNFSFSKGQLDQSELEVYIVVGTRERIIGYWSPEIRLDQNYSKGCETTSGKYQIKDSLWPGDTLDKPKTSRIGVPATNSFPELVNVRYYNDHPWFDGFAIDMFLQAVNVFPFPFPYELVPLPKETSSGSLMTYDDILCRQMKDKGLYAVIGDITIVANRTKCVDFTFPYLDSSVTMVVRVKISTNRGILFKPFKWSLWLILGGIFVIATIIIVILERNKTNEVRFNPFLVYKIDVTKNFASSAAGWMVILTSFLFILVVQVYTANLTSILTQVKHKEPSFEDANKIKIGKLSVGYRSGSWLRGFLIDQIGFNDSQLKPLGSREEYNEALSIGTEKGGVDAIFDETPYLTLFLSKYKSRFMMTGPIYKTGGFGFAFPKKSSMVSHFSNEILKVTQDVEQFDALMAKNSLPTSIEDLKFEDQGDIETTTLKIAYFRGLYPIFVSVAALFLGLAILNPSIIIKGLFKMTIKAFKNIFPIVIYSVRDKHIRGVLF